MHNSYNAAANFSNSNGGFLNYLWKNTFNNGPGSGNSQQQQQQNSYQQQQQQNNKSNNNNNKNSDNSGRKWG